MKAGKVKTACRIYGEDRMCSEFQDNINSTWQSKAIHGGNKTFFLTSVTYSLKIRGFLLSSFHQEVVQWHRVGEAYGTRGGGGLYWASLDLLRQLSLSRKCVHICQLPCWNAPVMLSVAFRFWPFSHVCCLWGKLTKDGLGSRKGGHFELFAGNQDFYRLRSPVSQVLMVCSKVQDNVDFSL